MPCSFDPTPKALEKMRRRGISYVDARDTANKGTRELMKDESIVVGEKYRAKYGRFGGIFIKQPCNIMCLTVYDRTQTKYHL